jgi:hypothetical protein
MMTKVEVRQATLSRKTGSLSERPVILVGYFQARLETSILPKARETSSELLTGARSISGESVGRLNSRPRECVLQTKAIPPTHASVRAAKG